MCASVPDFTEHVGYKHPAKKLAWGLDFKDQYRNCKHSLAWTQTTVWFGGIWTVCVGTTQPQAGYNCFGRIHCSIFWWLLALHFSVLRLASCTTKPLKTMRKAKIRDTCYSQIRKSRGLLGGGLRRVYNGIICIYIYLFKRFFCVFQSRAVFLSICCILELKSLICVLFAAFWS